jgi:DNA sulfur modification protein DndD
MNIQSIKVHNFGVYAGDQAIYPASRMHGVGHPITLIGGLNGFGKTSLLEAVLLALYGSRSPAVREQGLAYSAYLESLMHRRCPSDAECWVELTLALPVENTLSLLCIRRHWRIAKVRATEKLTVQRDGVEDAYLAENWDTYVEELIPVGIAGLFFFDGERISELAESDETTASLRQAIRTLLGLETIDRLITDLGVVVRRKQHRIRDGKVKAELDRLQGEAREASLVYSDARQRQAGLQNRLEQAGKRLLALEERYFQSGGALVESRDRLLAQRETTRAELAEIRAEIFSLAGGSLPLLMLHTQLARIHETAQREMAGQRVSIAMPLLQEHNDSILQELEQHTADVALIAHLREYVESRRQHLASLGQHERVLGLSPVAFAQLSDLLTNALPAQLSEAERLRDRSERLDYELEQIERHLLVDLDRDTVSDQLADLARCRGELAELEHTKERLERDVQSYKVRKERLEQQIDKIGDQLVELDDAERVMRFAGTAQVSLRQFRERVTQTKVAHLSEHITEAFDVLTHKTSLVYQIRVDPDSLGIALFADGDMEIPKSRLSSGERQMLALAVLWGLARASGRTLPVMIDTPMGRLDSSHRMNFVTRYLPNASHQVIVLSTDTEIIGSYLEPLGESIGQRYRLEFDDQLQQTRVVEGYFVPVGV